MNLYHKQFLLVIAIQFLSLFVFDSNQIQISDQCPSCTIPCAQNCENKQTNSTLVRTYNHQASGYSVIAFIDASNGNAMLMCSNKKGKIYSKSIPIAGYEMDQLCDLFSSKPAVTPPNSLRNYALVRFKYFPTQKLSLVNEIESKYFYLFQRTSLVVNDQKKTIQRLNDAINNHDAFENKVEMRKKLEYAIMGAHIYGRTYRCKPSNYKLQIPISARRDEHCLIDYNNWLYFDLAEEVTLNLIQMYHWDGTTRNNYYSLEVSVDKINWVSLASNRKDVRLSTIQLSTPQRVKYIRMTGYNDSHRDMTIYWLKLDWV